MVRPPGGPGSVRMQPICIREPGGVPAGDGAYPRRTAPGARGSRQPAA